MSKRQDRDRAGDRRGQAMEQEQQRREPTAADHLRTALSAATETEQMGTETLAELERQGEQLDRVQRKLDATEAHADRSNWLLKGMKSIFSFRGKAPPPPKEVVAAREEERRAGGSGKGSASSSSSSSSSRRRDDNDDDDGDDGRGQQHQKQKKRPAANNSANARRNQEDDLLDALSDSMTRIKATALGIGDELDKHDSKLDSITTGVERVDAKVKKATKDARDIARR